MNSRTGIAFTSPNRIMSDILSADIITRNSPTRAVRLSSGDASLEFAEYIYDIMRLDRPHMAARLSKLMPKLADDERHWNKDVVNDHVHIWALKVQCGSSSRFVAIVWFEMVEQRRDSASSSSNSSSGSGVCGPTAHIEVLWTDPRFRQFGFGTQLVQNVLVRYPKVHKWTAFTSRDMKKDAGVHKFWIKNGFFQESLEVGKVNQDGFFIRNAALQTSKRRRIQTEPFQVPIPRKKEQSN